MNWPRRKVIRSAKNTLFGLSDTNEMLPPTGQEYRRCRREVEISIRRGALFFARPSKPVCLFAAPRRSIPCRLCVGNSFPSELAPQGSQSFDLFASSDSSELTVQMFFRSNGLAFIVVIRFVVELFLKNVLDSRLGNCLQGMQSIAGGSKRRTKTGIGFSAPSLPPPEKPSQAK
jgi:hypothetical protein